MLALLLASPSTALRPNTTLDPCIGHHTTAKAFEPFSAKVWRLILWERGKPPRRVIAAQRQRLQCAAGSGHRAAIKKRWRADKRAFYRHRSWKLEVAALTPYDGWAIPAYIVMCESEGDFQAYNPGYEPHGSGSGPGGAYQIIASTWAAYGGLEFAPVASQASEEAQHIVAARIYAAEGSGPWECA